jgi:PAS domain S-box-containing protein
MSEQRSRSSAQSFDQSEERFRLLVESVQDYAIFLLDPDGYIISWNAGAQRMKGYSADEIIGKHFSIFYEPETAAIGHPANELAIAEEEGRYEEEGWRVRKGGSRFWANVVITALRESSGALTGFAKVTRDLTERRHAEEMLERRVEERTSQLAATNRRIASLNHQLSRSVLETDHRVKNNLQVITALIDVQLASHPDSDMLPRSEFQRLRSHVHTLALIHNQLTQGFKLDEPRKMLSVKAVLTSLIPLIQQVLFQTEVKYSIADAELPAKKCIALALIVNELVSNASRHGGSRASVRFTVEEQHAILEVADNGPGFHRASARRPRWAWVSN